MSPSPRVPVHVLTGFLGSGKTTLLNEALCAGFGDGTAVVVNEFGDVGLDALFLRDTSQETVVLKNGCVCCTVRTDLAATLLHLLQARAGTAPLQRIVIETSGIAEPLPILHTLQSDFNLVTRFRAGAVVCTVGASDVDATAARPEFVAQVTAADAIVVTKRDLAGADATAAAYAAIARMNPLADALPCTGRDFVAWLLQEETAPRMLPRAHLPAKRPDASRVHGVQSIVIHGPAPTAWPQFAAWLTRLVFLHGDRILRTKGVVFDAGRQTWIGVHGVQRFFHPPVHLAPREAPSTGACLVFITDGLDPELIERAYRRLVDAGSPDDPASRAMHVPVHDAIDAGP